MLSSNNLIGGTPEAGDMQEKWGDGGPKQGEIV